MDLWYSWLVLLSVNSKKNKRKRKKQLQRGRRPSLQRRGNRGTREGGSFVPLPRSTTEQEIGGRRSAAVVLARPRPPHFTSEPPAKREREWLSEREIEQEGGGTRGSSQTPVRAPVDGEVPVGLSPGTSEARVNQGLKS